ncbi:MAG: tRNA (cytidine(34)-2'-O)-methyltransferase [Verrucomicrobiota bacterium]
MFHVVLVEPEIPPNTGNIARLCLSTASRLHLVKPLGFSLHEKSLRRAGLDYWQDVDVSLWDSFEDLFTHTRRSGTPSQAPPNFHFLTTKAQKPYWDAAFTAGDYLVFGRETKGLPESLLETHANSLLTIPMPGEHARSLNLATAAGIVLYEALRQITLSPLS